MTDISRLVSTSSVSGAYRSATGLKTETGTAAPAAEGPSFAEMLRGATADAVQTLRESDAVAQAGIEGDATTQQVVEATLELESTLRIAVTMRDKLVEAYQEIMRMPV